MLNHPFTVCSMSEKPPMPGLTQSIPRGTFSSRKLVLGMFSESGSLPSSVRSSTGALVSRRLYTCSQLLVVQEGWGWGDSGLSDHQTIRRVLGAPSHPLSLQHQRLEQNLSPDGGGHWAPTELQESEPLCPSWGWRSQKAFKVPATTSDTSRNRKARWSPHLPSGALTLVCLLLPQTSAPHAAAQSWGPFLISL